MANVHRWGADDWIDRDGEVRQGEEDGREGKGKGGGIVKFSAGRGGGGVGGGGEGVRRRAMTF